MKTVQKEFQLVHRSADQSSGEGALSLDVLRLGAQAVDDGVWGDRDGVQELRFSSRGVLTTDAVNVVSCHNNVYIIGGGFK